MLRSDIGSEKRNEKPDPLEYKSAKDAYTVYSGRYSYPVRYCFQFLPQTTLKTVLHLFIQISSIHVATHTSAVFSVYVAFFINKSYREILR